MSNILLFPTTVKSAPVPAIASDDYWRAYFARMEPRRRKIGVVLAHGQIDWKVSGPDRRISA